MPSANGLHDLLLESAARYFPLADKPDENLYGFLYEAIKADWSESYSGKTPNFEEVLYAIYVHASSHPAGKFTGALGASVGPKDFPEILYFGSRKPVDANVLRHLSQHLVDDLIDEFRKRCREPEPGLLPKIDELGRFFAALAGEFNVAVVTTNYDDLISRSLPKLVTGFDPKKGLFEPGRIIDRRSWPCLLHLHGSVHFDMDLTDGDLHGRKWQNDLTAQFHQNSFGRSMLFTTEGNQFPTSSIIAGYGKTEQIQRRPFRTYYSELDRLAYYSDAVLFLGFSLLDAHVQQVFADYRDSRNRPVVFIDYADDGTMLAGHDPNQHETGPARALKVFRVNVRSTEVAYPAVPGGPRCGMQALLSRRSRRPRRGAQWPKADRFRSFKRRFPTRGVAPPFCRIGVGRRVLFVPAVASNARRR